MRAAPLGIAFGLLTIGLQPRIVGLNNID